MNPIRLYGVTVREVAPSPVRISIEMDAVYAGRGAAMAKASKLAAKRDDVFYVHEYERVSGFEYRHVSTWAVIPGGRS